MIPKIIHYCWLSDDPIPEQFIKYIEGWKSKLVDYEFIKWDFSVFDKLSSNWVAEAFDNKKYAFAADYIRLFAVYNYGGIYMDMDMELLKPFGELLDNSYMFAYESPDAPWIEAGCFGAEKNNEFLGDCLEYYEDRHFVKSDGSFDMLPLPKIMETIRQNHDTVLDIYPWYYFTAKSYSTGIESPTEETYTVHHFAGSWKTKEELEVYELSKKYSKYFGVRIGSNLAQYQGIIKKEGLAGAKRITKEKLSRKRLNKNS